MNAVLAEAEASRAARANQMCTMLYSTAVHRADRVSRSCLLNTDTMAGRLGLVNGW